MSASFTNRFDRLTQQPLTDCLGRFGSRLLSGSPFGCLLHSLVRNAAEGAAPRIDAFLGLAINRHVASELRHTLLAEQLFGRPCLPPPGGSDGDLEPRVGGSRRGQADGSYPASMPRSTQEAPPMSSGAQ